MEARRIDAPATPAPRQSSRVHAFRRRPVVYGILIAYTVLSTVLMAVHAVGVTSEHALLIVLVLFSLVASARPFVWDWLPFLGVVVMFNDLGTLVGKSSRFTHTLDPILLERTLLNGNVAAVWLQQHLRPSAIWLDAPLATVYLSFFIAPGVVGLWLWLRHRDVFGMFVAAYIIVMAAGFLTYVFYPETPPWLASQSGLLPHIDRVTVGLLDNLGGFGRMYAGADPAPNGAMPALHVSVPTLIVATIIGIRGWRPSRRWLWLLYPATMAFATLYLGEHYLVDAAAGAALGFLAYALIFRLSPLLRGASAAPPTEPPATSSLHPRAA